MKINEVKIDRIIRVIIGLGILSLLFFIESNLKFIGLIGIIPLLTGIIGFCPVYTILHISTLWKKDNK